MCAFFVKPLSVDCCLLSVARCVNFVFFWMWCVYSHLLAVCSALLGYSDDLLCVVCRVRVVVCCRLLLIICGLLFVVCCLLPAVRHSLFVARCALFVVLQLGVRCLWCGVSRVRFVVSLSDASCVLRVV